MRVLIFSYGCRITQQQLQQLHLHLIQKLLPLFGELNILVLKRDQIVQDRPSAATNQGTIGHLTAALWATLLQLYLILGKRSVSGLLDFNVHFWPRGDPPESPLDANSTARICSLIEAHLGLLVSVCGSGLLRLTDVGRSKVSCILCYEHFVAVTPSLPQVLGASRSFIMNGSVAAFGYAAGFKAMDASGAARLEQQMVALKQLTPAASRLLLSYLIFGKPMAIAASSHLYGTAEAAVHGTFLIARNGCDLLQAR